MYMTRAEKIEIAVLTIAFIVGCVAVGWLVIENLCR
jgi:hypothetical protein